MLVPAAGSAAIPGTQRVWFKTWGCAHNVSDSEYMMGQLAAYGYRLVGDEERDAADLWLLNSCTVKNPSQVRVSVCVCGNCHAHAGLHTGTPAASGATASCSQAVTHPPSLSSSLPDSLSSCLILLPLTHPPNNHRRPWPI